MLDKLSDQLGVIILVKQADEQTSGLLTELSDDFLFSLLLLTCLERVGGLSAILESVELDLVDLLDAFAGLSAPTASLAAVSSRCRLDSEGAAILEVFRVLILLRRLSWGIEARISLIDSSLVCLLTPLAMDLMGFSETEAASVELDLCCCSGGDDFLLTFGLAGRINAAFTSSDLQTAG